MYIMDKKRKKKCTWRFKIRETLASSGPTEEGLCEVDLEEEWNASQFGEGGRKAQFTE